MTYIKTFESFLNEYTGTRGTDEVMDVASLELVSPKLTVVEEDDAPFVKLKQLVTSNKGEEILDIVGHNLVIYKEPFEFIQWMQDNGIESFILKDSDMNKI